MHLSRGILQTYQQCDGAIVAVLVYLDGRHEWALDTWWQLAEGQPYHRLRLPRGCWGSRPRLSVMGPLYALMPNEANI
jgi:hypothetical protein